MARPAHTTPIDIWKNGITLSLIAAEAQAVITMRVWGMMGLWPVKGGENGRMVREKSDAMTEALFNIGYASLTGKRPDQVTAAALVPIRRRTRSNQRRLARNWGK